MLGNRHIVRRVTLPWRYTDPAVANAPPPELGALFLEELLPTLERVLDEVGAPGAYVQLDRLEVDLGLIDPANVVSLRETLAAALRRELREVGFGESRQTSLVERALASLEYFLKHGRLAWDCPTTTLAELERVLLRELEVSQSIRALPTAGTEALRQVLRASRAARDRFVAQLNPTVAGALLRVFGRESLGTASDRASDSDTEINHPGNLRAALLNALGTAKRQRLSAPSAFAKTGPASPGATERSAEGQHGRLERDGSDAVDAAASSNADAATFAPGTETEQALSDGLPVTNAGIILLHPFLTNYFERLGLLADGALTDPVRAIHLLHYLATGATELPEAASVLYKVLCGYPLTETLSRRVDLGEEERTESLTLLDAAVAHWGKLGKTSAEGLRQNFLQREGILRRTDNGSWRLTVERRGWDVLLESLPWNLSVVRMGWGAGVVWVEW